MAIKQFALPGLADAVETHLPAVALEIGFRTHTRLSCSIYVSRTPVSGNRSILSPGLFHCFADAVIREEPAQELRLLGGPLLLPGEGEQRLNVLAHALQLSALEALQ